MPMARVFRHSEDRPRVVQLLQQQIGFSATVSSTTAIPSRKDAVMHGVLRYCLNVLDGAWARTRTPPYITPHCATLKECAT